MKNEISMKTALPGCPFCGGKATLRQDKLKIKGVLEAVAFVRCKKCNARTNYFLRRDGDDYIKRAQNAWCKREFADAVIRRMNEDLRRACVKCGCWLCYWDGKTPCSDRPCIECREGSKFLWKGFGDRNEQHEAAAGFSENHMER